MSKAEITIKKNKILKKSYDVAYSNCIQWQVINCQLQIIIFITAQQETNTTSAIGPKVIDWEVTNWLVCTLGCPLLPLFRIERSSCPI